MGSIVTAVLTMLLPLPGAGKGARGGRRPDCLILIVLAPALLFLAALTTHWVYTRAVDNALRLVSRQLEVIAGLPGARPRAAKQPDLTTRVHTAQEYEELAAALRDQVLGDKSWFPSPSRAATLAREMEAQWENLRPLLHNSGRLDAEQTRRKDAWLSGLADTGKQLHGLLLNRRDRLRKLLLFSCAGLSMLCLVMLYAGLTSARKFLSALYRLIEAALEKAKGRLLMEAPSILTDEDLRQLRCDLPGLSANLKPLLEFVQEHCRNVEKILQDIPYGLLLVSGDLKLLTANRFFADQFGLPADRVAGLALGDILPSPPLSRAARRVLQTGCDCNVAVHLTGPRGQRMLRAALVRLRHGGSAEARLLVGIEDVSELHNARIAGREYEELSRQFLENVSEPLILANEACRIVGLNPAAVQLLGYACDELAGEPVETLAAGLRTEPPALRLASVLTAGVWRLEHTVLDLDVRRKDNTVFPAQLRPRLCRAGSHTYFLINVRDVSDQLRSEQLARDRLEVLEMIARNRSQEKVLTRLTQMVEGQLADSSCAVMLRREDRLYPAAAPSLPEAFVKAIEGMPVGPKAPACGVAAFQGTIARSASIADDPAWEPYRRAALEHGLLSCDSVPIHSSDGAIVGTVAVYSRRPGSADRRQVELLQTASHLAAVFLEQRQLNGKLSYQAQHDALTGLANRFTFQEHMRRAIAHSRRTGNITGILSVDLDRFKVVNDTLGHAVGDSLLKEVGARMQSVVRETDMVARWGGDEFIIGLAGLRHAQDADMVAQKLLAAMREPFDVDGHEMFLTATIGISLCPRDGRDFAELLKNADRAMYHAKNLGRDNVQWYRPELEAEAGQPLELAAQLRRALERGEFVLHYQPQYELKTGRLTGLEALLRWKHPSMGMVSPARFIRVAEDTGLIVAIGSWVIEQGCLQARAWRMANRPVKVAVNVSTLQCARSDFVDIVAGILYKSGVEPGSLELEMTESLIMRNVEESAHRLGRLRELGVSIAVDDFGTGYSSLSYLRRLPIDVLKIDGSFISDIAAPSGTRPLVESIVGMTRSLGMQATAEGVEDEAQLSALLDAGCHYVQGYLLGRPCPADEVQPYAEPLLSLIAGSSRALAPAVSPRLPRGSPMPGHPADPFSARPLRLDRTSLNAIRIGCA